MFSKSGAILKQKYQELVNLKIYTVHLPDNTKVLKEETNKFSSKLIVNEVVTITSETPSSEDHFETKLQAKFDKSDQTFEQQQQ